MMSSKPRKQSLQPRCYYDEEKGSANKQMKYDVPSSTPINTEQKQNSDSHSVQPGSSKSTSNPQPEKNIQTRKSEEVPTLKTKISLITCCEQDFEKKFGFRKHIRTKHPSTKEELRLCLHCNTMVKATATALMIHMRRNHLTDIPGSFVIADDEFLNKNCSISFLKASSKLAQKNRMPVASSMVFTCKTCDALFLDKQVYMVHKKSHEEPKIQKLIYFKECECGITFYEAGQYESHWDLMHSGNYSPCSNCHGLIDSKNTYAHVKVNQYTGASYYYCRKARRNLVV